METLKKYVVRYCHAFKEYSVRISFVALNVYTHINMRMYINTNITAQTFSLPVHVTSLMLSMAEISQFVHNPTPFSPPFLLS
jgi:hypothetical protein